MLFNNIDYKNFKIQIVSSEIKWIIHTIIILRLMITLNILLNLKKLHSHQVEKQKKKP